MHEFFVLLFHILVSLSIQKDKTSGKFVDISTGLHSALIIYFYTPFDKLYNI